MSCEFFIAEHKIVILGLDNAGKTTILYQFLMHEVVQTSPTIGSNVEEVTWKNIHFLMYLTSLIAAVTLGHFSTYRISSLGSFLKPRTK